MHFNQYKIPMNPFSLQVAECAKSDRCEYCHAPEVVFNFPFEVEQIIPIAKRGKTGTNLRRKNQTQWGL